MLTSDESWPRLLWHSRLARDSLRNLDLFLRLLDPGRSRFDHNWTRLDWLSDRGPLSDLRLKPGLTSRLLLGRSKVVVSTPSKHRSTSSNHNLTSASSCQRSPSPTSVDNSCPRTVGNNQRLSGHLTWYDGRRHDDIRNTVAGIVDGVIVRDNSLWNF